MYVAKKLLETNKGIFKKGEEVSEEIAKKYFRYVEEIEGELLTETPSTVGVKIEDPVIGETIIEDSEVEEVEEVETPKKKKNKK